MSNAMSLGAATVWMVLHLILMIGTAAFSVADMQSCGSAIQVQSWACGSPLEPLIGAQPQHTNFFARAAGVMGTVFTLGFRFFALDYDLLKGEGTIDGAIGLSIRFFGWAAAAITAASIGLRMFGRG